MGHNNLARDVETVYNDDDSQGWDETSQMSFMKVDLINTTENKIWMKCRVK